jgi:hypothetical protein
MDLDTQIFTRPKGATDTCKVNTNLVLGQVQAGSDLATVNVEPLRSDIQLDAAIAGRNGKASFRTKRSLVLHTGFVVTINGDIVRSIRIAMNDLEVAYHISELSNSCGFWAKNRLHVQSRG